MSKLTTTFIAASVHQAGDNPIFGESATLVQVDDDAGGGYVSLRQFPDDPKGAEIGMDIDELRAVLAAAEQLLAGYAAATEQGQNGDIAGTEQGQEQNTQETDNAE